METRDFHCGHRMIEIQQVRGIHSAELARIMDSTPQQIHRWRNQKDVSMGSLRDICEALNVSLADFFDAKKTPA